MVSKMTIPLAPSPWEQKRAPIDRRGPATVLGFQGSPTGSASAVGSTYWKRLMRCPHEHAMHELVQLRSKYDDEALTVGYLFHHALENYYATHKRVQDEIALARGKLLPDGTPDLYGPRLTDDELWAGQQEAEATAWASIDSVRAEPGYDVRQAGSSIPSTWQQLESCVAAYFDRYRRNERFRIVATEETLRWTDPDNTAIDYSARLDMLVENYDLGGLRIVEHKSARSITVDLCEGYQLDLQILGQAWLLRRCVDLSRLPPFRGVTVNITTKQKVPRFERVEVLPSEQHMLAFELNMQKWDRMRAVAAELDYPQAFGKCIGPDRGYRRCSYFDLCHMDPLRTISQWQADDVPLGFVRIDRDEDSVLAFVEDGEG